METVAECKARLLRLGGAHVKREDVASCKERLEALEKERQLPNISNEIEHMEFKKAIDMLIDWFIEVEFPSRSYTYGLSLLTLLRIK